MADRVRLSLFCPSCLPGYHLPFFSAAVCGLFADYGLIVDILDPPPPPGTMISRRVADGGADFCLTGVTYFLFAQKEAGDHFPARFVSVIHQRSPLAAIVPEGSDITRPEDLAGRILGLGENTYWQADEVGQLLADRGLDPPTYLRLPDGEPPLALGRGDIDLMAAFADSITRVRAKGGAPVRAIHLGRKQYASGLVANDALPLELVGRMRAALVAAFALEGDDLEAGMKDFCDRFPYVQPDDVRDGWALLQPYALCAQGVGSMDVDRWEETITWLCDVHGLPRVAADRVYRPELAERAK